MIRAACSSLLLAALLAAAPARAAEPACFARSLAQGPLAVSYLGADVGTARRACPRTEAGLGLQGGAIIDTPNFYGALGGGLLAFGSWAPSERLELFGTVEAVRFQFVQNATLNGISLALGQTTVGATYVALQLDRLTLAPTARLELPTSFLSSRTRTVGAELGVAAQYQPLHALGVHGYLGAGVSAGLTAAPAQPRAGVLAQVGADYTFADWFAVVLDVAAGFGRRAAVDHVSPAFGLRAGLGELLGAELAVTLPLAGDERHDGAGAFRITGRF